MSSDGLGLLLLVVALLCGLAGTWDIIAGAARRDELRDRALGAAPPPLLGRWIGSLERALGRTAYGHRLGIRLVAAGLRRSTLAFLLIAAACGAAAFGLSLLILPTLLAFVAGLLGVRGAFAWLERKRSQRQEKFVSQLPELARVLSNGSSAGLSVTAALQIAVQELGDPASAELSLALEEVRIGAPFGEAFEHMGERMPSRELAVLVHTLVIQQRAGGDLVRALSDMAETLEARKDTIREVKTLMAGAVATAYVVAGMGIVAVLLLGSFSPGSLDKVTKSGVGLICLTASGILYTIGFTLVRRVTRIQT